METLLYHFTAVEHVKQILESGYLKLTPSNLIEPKDLKKKYDENGNYSLVSEMSDSVKPVVWMTERELPDPKRTGLAGIQINKSAVRCVIPPKEDYKWWHEWSSKNRMKTSWKKRFTNGMDYGAWYICERPIPLCDILIIENVETGKVYWDRTTGVKEFP